MEHTLLTARLIRSVLLSEKTKHLEFVVEEVTIRSILLTGVYLRARASR